MPSPQGLVAYNLVGVQAQSPTGLSNVGQIQSSSPRNFRQPHFTQLVPLNPNLPETAWACICGFRNRPQNKVCGGADRNYGCNLSRNSQSEPWTCTCGFLNRPYNTVCGGKSGKLGCKNPRKLSQSWDCKCGFANSPYNLVCGGVKGSLGCKSARAKCEKAGKKKDLTYWTCDRCDFVNRPMNQVCGGVSGDLGCKQKHPRSNKAENWTDLFPK